MQRIVYPARTLIVGAALCQSMNRLVSSLPRVFEDVEGYDGRKNLVIGLFRSQPITTSTQHRIAVFFGGDCQDLKAKMQAHRDNRIWAEKRSLEVTVQSLADKMPNHQAILAVRPSEMYLGTFSIFKNFVPSNQVGTPDYSETYGAWKHLHALISAVLKRADIDVAADSISWTLIAFSKGCVVLNQLLVEAGAPGFSPLVNVDNIIFLDGGHSGEKGAWVTQNGVIENAVKNLPNAHFSVQVTPYQVQDTQRPWKAKEMKTFHKLLQKHASGREDWKLYFDDKERSLENHFNILDEFVV